MRKIAEHTITENNRDKGKIFLITEMSAQRAEAWAMRVIIALFGSNVDVPEGFEELGMSGLAQLGMKCLGKLQWDVAQPLLQEMMDCIQIIPIYQNKRQAPRILATSEDNEDIEEVSTRFALRVEVWKLHMDFLQAVAPSIFGKVQATAANVRRTKT